MLEIPGYSIIGNLPGCGYDTIYLAHRESDSKMMVVKTAERTPDPTIHTPSGRLLHEIQLLKSLNHQSIINMYDYGVSDTHIFCVLEYFEGGNLKTKITNEDNDYDKLRCLSEIISALSFIHNKELLHLDLNPMNIGIRKDGSFCLFDFGIATEQHNLSLRSKPGTVTGTPSYLAPEQILIPQYADCRTDIYSLGCVFYEVFTGNTLYPGDSKSIILKKKVLEKDRTFSEVAPPFDNFLQLCIAKKSNDRFHSIEQVKSWVDIFYQQ